ncbi:MAG TPA: DUF4412 domain-containing protein [Opitutaceae bacterium]|nr:DUF4412 domain-containing protein [Opitutaceae bacterium]
MKKITSLLLCLLLGPAALLAGSFEGTVRLSMKTPKQEKPMLIDYSMKEGFLRTDITLTEGREKGKTVTSIWDLNKHEMTTLIPDQKMYMVMKTQDLMTVAQKETPNVEIEKTGDTEKILGYETTKYLIKDKDHNMTSEVWAAEGLGTFMMGRNSPMGGKSGGLSPVEKELMARGFFPLRMINHDANGTEVVRMEAVAIDKKSLGDDMFAPPADYRRFDMGSLFGGFGGH